MSGMMAIAMLGSGKVQVTERFTSSQVWVAPNTTDKIITLIGKGQDGASASYSPQNLALISVINSPGSGGTSLVTNADMAVYADGEFSVEGWAGTGERVVSYTSAILYYDSVTNGYDVEYIAQNKSISGVATLFNRPSNTSRATGTAYVAVNVMTGAGSAGSNTSGFGYSFSGGVNGPSAPVTYNDVSITPGSNYILNIPAGGYIDITYLA